VFLLLKGEYVYDLRASRDGRFITMLYTRQVDRIHVPTPEEVKAHKEAIAAGTVPVEIPLEETVRLFFIAIIDINTLKVYYDNQIGNDCKAVFTF